MKSKKILSLFLVVSMVLTLLPVNVFATSASSNGTLNVQYCTEGGSNISQQNIGFNAGDEIGTSDLTIPNNYALSTSKTGFWYGQNNNSSNYSFQSSNVYLHSFDWSGSTKYKFTKSSTDTANAIPNSSTGSSNPTAKVKVFLKYVPLLDHVDIRVNLVENVTTWVNGVSSTTTKNYTIDSASDVSIQVNGTTYTNPVLRIDGTAREYDFDLSRAEFALNANTAITITANITDEEGNEKAYIYTPDYAAMVEASNNCPRAGTNGAGLDFNLEANTIITNNTSSAVIINFVDEDDNTIKTTTSSPYEYGTAYSETGVLPAGYELVDPSVSLAVAGIMGAGDVICTFTVRPINYNITYNLDGGTNSVNNPGTYTVKDSIIKTA